MRLLAVGALALSMLSSELYALQYQHIQDLNTEQGWNMQISYPRTDDQDAINRIILQAVQQDATIFKQKARKINKKGLSQYGLNYRISLDNKKVLSVLFDSVRIYNGQTAPTHHYWAMNIDKQHSKLLTPQTAFGQSLNYRKLAQFCQWSELHQTTGVTRWRWLLTTKGVSFISPTQEGSKDKVGPLCELSASQLPKVELSSHSFKSWLGTTSN